MEIWLSSSQGRHLLILFLFFHVILKLGIHPFPFYLICGFSRMVLSLLILGLLASFISSSPKSFLGIPFELVAPHISQQSAFPMTRSRLWAGGCLKHGIPTSKRTQWFFLQTFLLHPFSIFHFLMLNCFDSHCLMLICFVSSSFELLPLFFLPFHHHPTSSTSLLPWYLVKLKSEVLVCARAVVPLKSCTGLWSQVGI